MATKRSSTTTRKRATAPTGKGQVTIRGRFVDGKVELVERRGDTPVRGRAAHTATVKDGEATFTGLAEGSEWWAFQEVDGQVRHAAVTAKAPAVSKPRVERPAAEILAQTRPADHPGEVVTGPRGTRAAQFKRIRDRTGRPEAHEKSENVEHEPHPRVKQADVPDNRQQRSATPMGEGHPVDPDEIQPKIPQSEIPEGTPQRSDTPLGEATLVATDEVQPAVRQGDVPDSTKQRSDTPEGQAEPVPTVGAVDSAQARSSSVSKAWGATKGQAAQEVEPKTPGSQTSSLAASGDEPTKVKRSRKKPAKKKAATRRRSTARKPAARKSKSTARKKSGPPPPTVQDRILRAFNRKEES